MSNNSSINHEPILNYSLFLGASLIYLKMGKRSASFHEKIFVIGEGLLTATALTALPVIFGTENNSKKPPSPAASYATRIVAFLASFAFARFVVSRLTGSRISEASQASMKFVPLTAMAVKLFAYKALRPSANSPSSSSPSSSSSNSSSSSSPSSSSSNSSSSSSPSSSSSNSSSNSSSSSSSSSSPSPSPSSFVIKDQIALSEEERNHLITTRQPLIDYLSNWFELDSWGYIIKLKDKINEQEARDDLTKDETSLGKLLYNAAFAGDAGYAEEIRVTLAGLNIASSPVNKSDGQKLQNSLHTSHRPYSYVPLSVDKTGNVKTPPPKYTSKKGKQAPAYMGAWDYAIWSGYKKQRSSGKQAKDFDRPHTVFQKVDYHRRWERIRSLHKNGLLVGRVANTHEAKDFMGHRYNMHNDILSTTLWPKEGSLLEIQLFCEYGTDTVGLLLDPTKVGVMDFGVGFKQNAVTVGSGFISHKHRIGYDGVSSLKGQKELMEIQQTTLEEGGSVHGLMISINKDDPSKYNIKKPDARSASKAPKKGKVHWNEQTFYRGIERDFFTGFFVKSDSDSFSKELKTLFQLQDRIRRQKGLYVPIFQFKGKTNELEELVPDSLLLSITGLGDAVEPMQGRQSRLSKALEEAGITTEMALNMTKALPEKGNILSLLEIQLLMFNMKDITGQMTVKTEKAESGNKYFSFEPIRLLDNLHLVFPTINQTKNKDAKQPELFFSRKDVSDILGNQHVSQYFQATLRHNLARFLGISISQSGITFDPKNANLFDTSDPKRSDFAKVLSRAMQCATLFKIFGKETERVVSDIVLEVRKTWPFIGMAPSGHDHILNSPEIKAVRSEKSEKQPKEEESSEVSIPPCPTSLEAIDPFAQKIPLPSIEKIEDYLARLGIQKNGAIDKKIIEAFRETDPYLDAYEKELIQAVQLLHILSKDEKPITIMTNLRQLYPPLGFDVTGKDRSAPQGDLLIHWIDAKQKGEAPPSEFPFQEAEGQKTVAAPTGRFSRGRRSAQLDLDEEEAPSFRGRFPRRSAPIAQASSSKPGNTGRLKTKSAKMNSDDLRAQMQEHQLIPACSKTQREVAQTLGLVNDSKILWDQKPEFYHGEKGKPKAPYIAPEDVLGAFAPNLMTGPAFDPTQLKEDQGSFRIDYTESHKKSLERWVTHTLAVTTEGDQQVIRPNGLHYSHSTYVPAGGNIEFNGGNEKHRFRSNESRKYHKSVYQYQGAYTDEQLKDVEKYDQLLLSDQERRLKRAHMLPSAYVTVTARGGYGSERVPLAKAHRVLYLETAGAQFEKYGRGAFTYQDGTVDTNELEASDFIIKKGAKENVDPLFPSYYRGGEIPAHRDVKAELCATLEQGDFSKSFTLLKDGSLFNRTAFQVACNNYMEFICYAISNRLKEKPIYLKATFFGGGFFAQANDAGNLRSEVLYATLESYIKAIQAEKFPAGSVIEFPRYGEVASLPQGLYEKLTQTAEKAGLHVIWTPEGDICDYEPQTTVNGTGIDPADFEKEGGALVVLGAADVMSWSGNERNSASVEAAFGNNSNLRLVMNWWANPKILSSLPS